MTSPDPSEDTAAREAAEDRAIEVTPHVDLPAWPPSLLDHFELLAEALTTPGQEESK